jgi:hypothetical protein
VMCVFFFIIIVVKIIIPIMIKTTTLHRIIGINFRFRTYSSLKKRSFFISYESSQ